MFERKASHRHDRRLQVACFVVNLIWPYLIVHASPPPQASGGLAALQNRDFERAYQAFAEELMAAEAANDSRLTSTLHFYLGLTRQQQAEASKGENQDQAKQWLEEARKNYEQAMQETPASGGILNNLAQVYQRLGEDQKAAETFEKAIALADNNQAAYTVNYADFLATRNTADAIEFYRQALKQQPANDRAHRALLDLYSKHDRDKVSDYVWWLYENGYVPRAEATALEKLADPELAKSNYKSLLTCLCRCLSEHPESAEGFAIGPTAKSLNDLLQKPDLKAPAEEILRLYSVEPPKRTLYPWWADAISLERGEDPPRGGWPQEAFGALIRALGDQFLSQKDPKRAENYYLCAYRLNPRHLDPEALVRLADLWVRTNQRKRLEDFLKVQEREIFHGKSDAIASMRFERAYAFHRALGIVYSHLGMWGDAQTPGSAIFQLKNALAAAERYNEQVAGKELSARLVEPRLVDLLAKGYLQTQRPEEARKLRVKQAEYFRRLNRPDEADYLLRPIRDIHAPGGSRERPQEIKPDTYREGLNPSSDDESRKRSPAPVLRILPSSRDKLDEKEVALIERSLRQLLAMKQREQRTSAGRYGFMPANVDPRIVKVEFDGVAGRAFYRRARADVAEVQFTVYGEDKSPVGPFRFVRPRTVSPSDRR